MTQAVGGIVRIVDLSFRLTGISEQNKMIQDLTRRANIAISVLTTVIMLQRMVAVGMIPGIGAAFMIGATVLGAVGMIIPEFTDKEESFVRGH